MGVYTICVTYIFCCEVYFFQGTRAFFWNYIVNGGPLIFQGTMLMLHFRNEAHPFDDGGLLQELFKHDLLNPN